MTRMLSTLAPPKIEVRNVSKLFTTKGSHRATAIRSITLSVRDHEFIAVVGPSGGGKTTLLNLIAGLYMPDSGEVLIDGKHVNSSPPKALGYMLARDALLPWRTVQRNVEYGLELQGIPAETRRLQAHEMIKAVGLDDSGHKYPEQLSSGMRQRVAIARTFVTKPDILLLDEPFSALDAQTRWKIQAQFLGLWESQLSTVIMVTHDVGEAIALADRIVVLSHSPAEVRAEVEITFARPRNIRDLQRQRDYHVLLAELLDYLEEEEDRS